MPAPSASVIMPVYNNQATLAGAIDAILKQSFTDFELIVINDGSADLSNEIIDSFEDSRIRHIRLRESFGAIAAVNLGLAEVEAPFIIRANADSISLPGRFEKQMARMAANPEIDVCGCGIISEPVDNNPITHDDICARMLFANPISDGTAVFRSSLLKEKGYRYRDLYPGMAEYDLWYRLKNYARFANIPEKLVQHQIPNPPVNIEDKRSVLGSFCLDKLTGMGISPTEKQLKRHVDLADPGLILKLSKPKKYKKWLGKLVTTNSIIYSFPREAFNKEAEHRWHELFRYIEKNGNSTMITDYLKADGKTGGEIWKYKIGKWFRR